MPFISFSLLTALDDQILKLVTNFDLLLPKSSSCSDLQEDRALIPLLVMFVEWMFPHRFSLWERLPGWLLSALHPGNLRPMKGLPLWAGILNIQPLGGTSRRENGCIFPTLYGLGCHSPDWGSVPPLWQSLLGVPASTLPTLPRV